MAEHLSIERHHLDLSTGQAQWLMHLRFPATLPAGINGWQDDLWRALCPHTEEESTPCTTAASTAPAPVPAAGGAPAGATTPRTSLGDRLRWLADGQEARAGFITDHETTRRWADEADTLTSERDEWRLKHDVVATAMDQVMHTLMTDGDLAAMRKERDAAARRADAAELERDEARVERDAAATEVERIVRAAFSAMAGTIAR